MKNEESGMKNFYLNKMFVLAVILFTTCVPGFADNHRGRLQIGTGLLYERGMDLTVAYEHETRYHNAWEYFGNVYLKWDECASCGHVCPKSFWNNYNTWGLGVAYKPCVTRGRNHHGNLRIGGSLGSDRHNVVGSVHAGYEHSYSLRKGWQVYWQVKSDLMIGGKDLFRTGVVIGVKLPVK